MSDPTVYFPRIVADPSNNPTLVKIKLGFTKPRQWSTLVTGSPTGRTQRRKMWKYPKRSLLMTVWIPEMWMLVAIRDFLYDNAGQYRRFFVFDPHEEDYFHAPVFPVAGVFATAFPVVLPFLGGTITKVLVDESDSGTTNFSYDDGGPGGEKRITGYIGMGSWIWGPGSTFKVDIAGARIRLAVRSTSDVDQIGFDWTAAIPPTEIQLSFQEDWG